MIKYARVLIILIIAGLLSVAYATGTSDDALYVEGEVLVKYRSGLSTSSAQLRNTQFGATSIREFRSLGVHHLMLPEGVSVEEGIEMFRRDPEVLYVEPNYIRRASVIPNDPDFDQQWGLHNTGQPYDQEQSGTPDADIDAPEAWDIHTGTGTVVIAVLDSGIDLTHPDLAANLWINPGEAGNCSDDIDNDNNGYTDDCYGWDFVNNDNDPTDDHTKSHGTHVSGIIGAVGNNGAIGNVAGVNWNVRIMPLKFLDSNGNGSIGRELDAIAYAKNNGADIISASYGGTGFSTFEKAAIESFGAAGGLFVAAAGNRQVDNDGALPEYPSSHSINYIISVAATNSVDSRAWFSNYGANSVHVAAPGQDIYSTMSSGTYGWLSGTSMATPMVSGLSALVLSQTPALNNLQIRETVLNSVDQLASLDGVVMTGGRINAASALLLNLLASPPSAPNFLTATASSASQIDLSWVDNSTVEEEFKLERKEGMFGTFAQVATPVINATSYPDSGLNSSTTYYYRLRATNAAGDSAYSQEDDATTNAQPVAAPSGLINGTITSSSIVLMWTDNSDNETGFSIERRVGSSGPFIQVATTSVNTETYTDTELDSLTTYNYRVRAFNNALPSPYSSIHAVTTASSGGGGGGGGKCFIATAAYGNKYHPNLDVLRDFRDKHLLTNIPGRSFVKLYYKYSPPMAKFVSERPALRWATRAALAPVVYSVRHPGAGILSAILILGLMLYGVLYRRKRKRRTA